MKRLVGKRNTARLLMQKRYAPFPEKLQEIHKELQERVVNVELKKKSKCDM
jgi:23S rRNA C2498 (ribose-2'-O)-methylase RlmM